jgi:preprotein translocase subunit SecF
MNTVFRCAAMVFILFSAAGCGKRLNEATLPIGIKTGNIYYTQVTFQYEKGRHLTTNYRKGTLVPINTQVQLQEITSGDIMLEILPAHSKLRIENVEKHTGDDVTRAFNKLFGKNKVNLGRFSSAEREYIASGRVGKGMTKKAVIAAIGYPPITETPSLEGNEWTYWSSRFNRFIVKFQNDKVAQVQD